MSEYCVYLKMPSYLRQWFIHRHGGSNPVNLIRGSIESKLLQRATVPLPAGVLPALQQDHRKQPGQRRKGSPAADLRSGSQGPGA